MFLKLYLFLQSIFQKSRFAFIGLLYNDEIYTVTKKIHYLGPRRFPFDLVFIRRGLKTIVLYFVFSLNVETLTLTHPKPGESIHIFDNNDEKIELLYEAGTPFRLRHGKLKLIKRVRAGRSFTSKVIAEGESWPLDSYVRSDSHNEESSSKDE